MCVNDEKEPLDEVASKLIQAGLVPNEFVLDLNHGIEVPDDVARHGLWSLPSRLFRFPVCVDRVEGVGPRHVWWLHPALVDHPFRGRLELVLGRTVAIEPPTGVAGFHHRSGRWWHAIDLAGAGLWSELLETRRFTTDTWIACAVSNCLRSKHLYGSTIKHAYRVLETIGLGKQACAVEDVLEVFMRPSPLDGSYPVNDWGLRGETEEECRVQAGARAWAFIAGLERGLFEYDRRGYLQWTAQGVASWKDWSASHDADALNDQAALLPTGPFQGSLCF